MAARLYKAPARILIAWAGALCGLAALAVLADFALARLARAQDARDYRVPLAEVAAAWEQPGFSPVAAKEAIDRAVALAPERPEPWVMLGHLHYRLANWRQAVAAYREAVARSVAEVGVVQNMVWCHIELGDYAAAAALGRRALADGRNGPLLHRYTGEALYRAGEHDAARGHFERALAESDGDRHLMYRLADIYRAVGDIAAAEAMEERISHAEAQLGALGNAGP